MSPKLKNSDPGWTLSQIVVERLEEWLKEPQNPKFIKRYKTGQFKCD